MIGRAGILPANACGRQASRVFVPVSVVIASPAQAGRGNLVFNPLDKIYGINPIGLDLSPSILSILSEFHFFLPPKRQAAK